MNKSTLQSFEVKNPFDRSVVATLNYMPQEEAFGALQRASEAFLRRQSWIDPAERIAILRRLGRRIEERFDELVQQAVLEGGKPKKDTEVEIRRAINGIEVAVREIANLGGQEIPMRLNAASQNRIAYTFYEPRGVVLAISAFNHPFNLIVHQVITAVAAGCPVLVKPASSTPLSCRSIVQMLHECGLPPAWCQLLLVPAKLAEQLVSDERVAFLSFIGSARVGWHLRSKLSPGATCALEHGGAAPVILDASARFEDAIPSLVRAAYYHAGQVCVSAQRFFVHRSVADEFCERFVQAVKELRSEDPRLESCDVGPLIECEEVSRLEQWVQEAMDAGAKCLCGGKALSETSYAPTVLLEPPVAAKVSKRELFGPVACVYRFDDLDEAIARANDTEFYFQASLYTQDLDTALGASRQLEGMAVMINEHPAFRVDWMPFGGHRHSGLGVGGIGYSMRDMMLERMVVFRSPQL